MTELEVLNNIYNLLSKLVPLAQLITGFIQFAIVVFAIVVLYRLFKIFF